MSLLVFVAVAAAGATAALFARTHRRLAPALGIGGLAGALVAAVAIRPGQSVEMGGSVLVATDYARAFLVLGCLVGIGLALVGLAGGTRRDAPAVTLGTLVAAALALGLPDARVAILASTAGAFLGVLVTLVPGAARAGAVVGIRELRAVVIAGALAVGAAAWVARPSQDPTLDATVAALAYLGFTLAVAIRFGAIPFHVWAARLADTAPEVTVPVLSAWGPAALAVVALGWVDSTIAPGLPDVGPERTVLVAIALASIVLAALAAAIQDDLEHVLGYAIVSDAGVILLALAALDPAAWGPARTWILAFVVVRSALAAWTAAVRVTFWTGRIDDLRGWALRSPALLAAFVAIGVAGVGLPGLAAFDARAALVTTVFDGPAAGVVLVAVLAPLAYHVRLLATGLARPPAGAGGNRRPPSAQDDRTAPVGVAARLLRVERAPFSAVLVLLLAVAALGTSAGAFGLVEAAAGPGPDGSRVDAPRATFRPLPTP